MTKYVQRRDGKMAGSIGDGKNNVPTAAPTIPVTPVVEPRVAQRREYNKIVGATIIDAYMSDTALTFVTDKGNYTFEAAEGCRLEE